ncbi:MAG: YhdP family phospholipid transporter, partial [Acidiferrobacteraceae bacterium]
HHKVDISADFPPGVCAHCAFLLDVSGSPRSLARVSGEAYAHLQGVHIAHLPWILRHYLPPGSGGRVDVQVWSRWRRGAPVSVKGTLVARDLTVPANRWTNEAHVSVLAGDFAWHGSRSAWTLEVQHGRMGGGSAVWKFGHLLARVGRQGSDIQLSRLDLDQVSWFLAHARVKSPLFTALGQIDPDGLLHKVRIRLQGPVNAPRRFWLDASASRLAAAAYGPYPGFNGIDGVIQVYNGGGTFVIRSMKGSVFWPRYFKKSLTVDSATGDLSWTRGPQGWSVHSKELSVRTADGALRTGFTLGLPKASPSTLDMHLTAADVDLAKIRPLYEAIPKPQLRHWLRSSLRGGIITHGELTVQGPLSRFPFTSGGGVFSAHADVAHGRFRYLKKWAPLQGVMAHLVFQGGHMALDGTARMGRLKVAPLKVRVADFSAPAGSVVAVQGTIEGSIADMLGVLRASDVVPKTPHGLVAAGHGVLTLAINVPIHSPKAFTLDGSYRTGNGSLSLPEAPPWLSHFRGNVRFSRQGPIGGHVDALLFGGPLNARVVMARNVPVLQLKGKTAISALAPVLPSLARHASGVVPWHAQARMVPGVVPILQFSADLTHTELHLPRPLHKRAGVADRLEITTVRSEKDATMLVAHLGALATAQIEISHYAGHWSVPRGRITVGGLAAPMPRAPGITVAIFAHRLNASHWLRLGSGQSGGMTVSHLILKTAHLVLLKRDFDTIDARLDHTPSGWKGKVTGPDAEGTLEYQTDVKPAVVRMAFTHLVIPKARSPLLGPPAPPSPPVNPASLPEIVLKSASLEAGDRALGAVDLLGVPEPGGWRIAHANFTRPEGTLQVSGDWFGSPVPHTRLSVELATRNLGQTLTAFAVPGQVAGGVAHVAGSLHWPGSPGDFSLARLHGDLTFAADNGRFKRLHQGAGKLLGLFDIHSIVRYLTLDFSTLFKSGYVFDHIRGNLRIQDGDAHTAGITVTGPSANLMIQGDADLTHQLFDLQVSVDPRLSDTLTIAGASLFASPVAGAAVLLMQRVFRKQISAGTRLVYFVRGPWSHPVIREKPDHDHD